MKRHRDHSEILGMMRRMIRAYGRRVALGLESEDDLRQIVALREDLDAALVTAIAGLRASGHSWQLIADSLGVTRQTAWKLYAGRVSGHGSECDAGHQAPVSVGG